jgi:hypothetical protein
MNVEEEEEEEEELPPRQPLLLANRRQRERQPPPQPEEMAPSRSVRDEFQFQSDLDGFRPSTLVEGRRLPISVKGRETPHVVSQDLERKPAALQTAVDENPINHVQQMIRQRKSLREMMLMHEILSPPKSLR